MEPAVRDDDKRVGFWWPEENYLPKRHKVCNKYCRPDQLIHMVTISELSTGLSKDFKPKAPEEARVNKFLWSIAHPIQFIKIVIYSFKATWRKFYE